MSELFIALLLLFFALLYLWIRRCYSYWSSRGLIQCDGKFPFGSLAGVGTKVTSCEKMDEIYRSFKGKAPAIGIYFFLKPTLMVLEPELLKKIFVRDFSSFQDRGFYFNTDTDPLSANLLTLEGTAWKERRVKLSPVFTSGKMKMMFNIIDSISTKLVESVGKQLQVPKDLEMRDWSQKYTADNIGNTAFGLECNCLEDENSEFLRQGRRLFDLTPTEALKFFFTVVLPDLSKRLGMRLNPKEPSDFFLSTFLQTFEYRERNNVQRNDFVQLLLGLKDSLTPTELAAEGLLVFAAGYETSSTLMAFTLYELALNPDIQSRLREEITAAGCEKLTYETLNGFKYLDMIANETLRKYPPIPTNIRKCTKDYLIEEMNFTLAKGISVQIPTYSFQNDPEYFSEPEKYDPERFNDENIKNIKPFTFFPFGEGGHQCLGMRFGLMQSKMGIAKLIRNFSFAPCEKTAIPMKFVPSAPFLAPVGGLWLRVERI